MTSASPGPIGEKRSGTPKVATTEAGEAHHPNLRHGDRHSCTTLMDLRGRRSASAAWLGDASVL